MEFQVILVGVWRNSQKHLRCSLNLKLNSNPGQVFPGQLYKFFGVAILWSTFGRLHQQQYHSNFGSFEIFQNFQ